MKKYTIVCWPESQMIMEKEGFYDNCSLINSEKGIDEFGSSAYLVDNEWYQSFIEGKLKDITEEEILENELECIYDDDIIFNN